MESQSCSFLDTLKRLKTPGYDQRLLSQSEKSNFEAVLALILEKNGVLSTLRQRRHASSKSTVAYITDLLMEREGHVYEPLDEILLRDTTLEAAFPSPQLYNILHELYFGAQGRPSQF